MSTVNEKYCTITSLRWGVVPYTAGSGLHVGAGSQRTFPNAIGVDTATAPGVDLLMKLDRLPLFADGVYDFVVVGDALQRVAQPRQLLADCWRVLGVNGFLILDRPTSVAAEWVQDADSPYRDFVHHTQLRLGARQVDVFQKLAAGEGRHAVPPMTADKTVAVIRPGGFGDALWASSILPALKEEGYHITMYVQEQGEDVLRHDPHIDRLIVVDEMRVPGNAVGPYWAHEVGRYDRVINLTECVEKNMLAVPTDLRFFWPAEERRRLFNHSYLAAVHRLAGVPLKFAQRFYATREETAAAAAKMVPGKRAAVIAVSGSTLPKFWPYVDELTKGLAERGYAMWILGELRGLKPEPRPDLHVIGTTWSIRDTLAFSQLADLVVGQETGILNAVALEKMRKVVLLSHSTAKQLTHFWTNTVALHGDAPCWPCHQIHYLQNGWFHCNQDEKTKLAKCQATITPEAVLEAVDRKYVIRAAA